MAHNVDEREAFLAGHRTEIAAKIEEGFAASQRGELLEPDAVRQQLEDRKRAWLGDRRGR